MEIPSALRVHEAQLTLSGHPVLRDASLELPRGQVLALLGASGCGKTTLLRAISGLTRLDAGRIELNRQDVTAVPAEHRGIGFVFQHYALFPNLDVRQNIGFALAARREPPQVVQARVRDLLDLTGLTPLADSRPSQLSGGQRQRVALARALAPKPSVLLLDEPFSALDESFRLPLRRSFRRLQTELQQSCVLVTHDRDEAFEIADLIAVMIDGRIAQCGRPADLWKQPVSREVAEFLGAFNILDATTLPVPWARPVGTWISPVDALRLDDATCPDARWNFKASVSAIHPGRQHVSVDLLAFGGQTLNLVLPAPSPVPPINTEVGLCLPLASMRWLPP